MPNLPNQRVDLFKRHPIVVTLFLLFVGGLCGALLQWSGYLWQALTTEKKLTASGIDSVMIAYDYVVSPSPTPGYFNRVLNDSESETVVAEIKKIEVYDGSGGIKKEIDCQGADKCKVLIKGQGTREILIADGNGADDGKVLLKYVKNDPNEHRNSSRKKWGFLKTFNIREIELFVNDSAIAGYSPGCTQACSVDVTFLY